MIDFWNNRYETSRYAYGLEPNLFFKKFIDGLFPATILLPGEGQGRNAVYAAKNGWKVFAFDHSSVAQDHALFLAQQNKVDIHYEVSSYEAFQPDARFDVIALIYAHIHEQDRQKIHQKFIDLLKPDGFLMMESFSKNQISHNSGGPKSLELLYDLDEIKQDFSALSILKLEEEVIDLQEGQFHQGMAQVVRLIGQKQYIT
ncbi:MAG: class I SAM-dependent methyltransferase [Candidatus Cyclobacteriaceae bacterium M3_2C_046]